MPSSRREWAAFDSLPKPAREAIANSNSFIHPYSVIYHNHSGMDLVQFVKDMDREVTRKTALKDFGKDHPEA